MTVVAGCTVETVSEGSIVIQTGVGSGWTWCWDVRSGWTVGASWTHVLILGRACVVTVPTSTTVSYIRRKTKRYFNISFTQNSGFNIYFYLCLDDFLHMAKPDLRAFNFGYQV